ncbi:hypothetical protein F0562_004771 [Nyssa sinensis]|uniref:Pre-mRNA-splicing factor Syf1/CRNKL1-like C-terminal HAT-repeats domain-containing protein n=1 Tax=Nyssa sinensis TaxID=561372 RepID=A0A5J5AJV1_9ASTE|nr:hypothetical protein F0562_004771 [Nyssa sinensis]
MATKYSEVKLPRLTRVKIKSPATIQITAEQVLREARERQEAEIQTPKQKIIDSTELADYRLPKTQRVRRTNLPSAMERKSLDQIRQVGRVPEGLQSSPLGLGAMPRGPQRKLYAVVEGNVAGARQIYERWIKCHPDLRIVQDHPRNGEIARRVAKDDKAKQIRDVHEKGIANVPPAEKCYWQRYIYLWINYALYEELDTQDMERTRNVYRECLKLIPHDKFSFSKIWILAAQFEIRQLNLKGARQILGNAIGRAPKHKIFKKYIEIELQLGNIDRCRKLYEKYLEWSPENCYAWSKYAQLERSLSENQRARGIYELAIAQPTLDMPELLWKSCIDFEISQHEFERSRELYERLLDRTKHLKVWISYAKFEASSDLPEDAAQEQKNQCLQRARRVFEKAINYYRTCAPELKEERAMLLEEWSKMESDFGELGDLNLVRVKLPKKLKRRRQIEIEDGLVPARYEYIDYLFPEEMQTTNLKILEAAYSWKKQKSGAILK